ncbi:uncharacterized protein PHALS_01697 [Plasmopara halstedii]|uniref:Uncharacterized protein n=1 Tax=Plasmopara halstedii TaxID=4781 RepID=A0A0P1AWC7_PLAHL|nr:uncharacterized protein PHALS_01697 [Plasmopara halstedii]CEG45398.1 hypothetical protein PHALS_01697 [Plasmopara halstedii]|eukprot:XP_024581767.1 hypothetical protein PHALS_01697 [Plasmopara halstedii]
MQYVNKRAPKYSTFTVTPSTTKTNTIVGLLRHHTKVSVSWTESLLESLTKIGVCFLQSDFQTCRSWPRSSTSDTRYDSQIFLNAKDHNIPIWHLSLDREICDKSSTGN